MEMVLNPGLSIATHNVEQTVSLEVALVRRAQEGDQAAFRLLVEKYQSKVFSIIHGVLRNRNDVQTIRISVENVDVLEPRVHCPGNKRHAWPVWVGPRVLK